LHNLFDIKKMRYIQYTVAVRGLFGPIFATPIKHPANGQEIDHRARGLARKQKKINYKNNATFFTEYIRSLPRH